MNKLKIAGLGWEGYTGQIARIKQGFESLGHELTYENPNIIFLTMKWKIDNFNILISLISIGFIGVFGFLLLFQAYRIGSPPSIAPFEYIILILALFISWFLWNETLTTKGFFGLSLIVFAGIYTFYREFKKQQRLSIDKPMIQ